ncbi:Uncharacterised protein [Weissella viridescens]|uniref:Uncharacterized protein n=1 Tax=Weissella viridescens TaxID=1629 RepID=A0A380P0E0_WEIVI|nr:Uncharacterised protein [Weissella viridescens]
MINKQAGVDKLTKAQLTGIFTGKIKTGRRLVGRIYQS